MIVGVLTVELVVCDARTLKEKRSIVQSVQQRIRNSFNVSVAEIAHRDAPRRCSLGVAMVARQTRAVHSQLDRIVDLIRSCGGLTLLNYERELY